MPGLSLIVFGCGKKIKSALKFMKIIIYCAIAIDILSRCDYIPPTLNFRFWPGLITSRLFLYKKFTLSRGWFQWFVQPLKKARSARLCLPMGVPTTAGFAIRSSSNATVATADRNFHPAGIAPHVRSHQWSGKTATVTWPLMWAQQLPLPRPRSIRSKLLKELADKPACDQSVNPAPVIERGIFSND